MFRVETVGPVWKRLCGMVGLALSGCGHHAHVGVAQSEDVAPIVQVSGHAALPFVGLGVRGGANSQFSYLATGPELTIAPGLFLLPEFGTEKRRGKKKKGRRRSDSHFSPSVHLGLHTLQWDWTDRVSQFGAGSPYLNVGSSYCHEGRRDFYGCVGLSLDAAHHVRFDNENQTWVGVSLTVSHMMQYP